MSSTTACSGRRCPPCFLFDSDFGHVHLKIESCHQNQFSSVHGVSVLTNYQFTNIGVNSATVEDDVGNTYLLPRNGQRGSSIECNCYGSIGQGYLACDASVTPVLPTAAYTSVSAGTGCAEMTSGTYTLNLASNTACGFQYCPQCFALDTSSGDVTVTCSNCEAFQGYDPGTQVVQYEFANVGSSTNKAYIGDGTHTYLLGSPGQAQSRMGCMCRNDLFICDNPNVLESGLSTYTAHFPNDHKVLGKSMVSDAGTTYSAWDSGASGWDFYVAAARSLSLDAFGGTLHGTWAADSFMVTSDKRLKRQIRPLRETLREIQAVASQTSASGTESASSVPELDPSLWVLRELRPVSFRLRSEASGGGRRFGFLAQDLELLLPDLVNRSNDENRTRRIHQQDLIAVLTAALQALQSQVLRLQEVALEHEAWRRNAEALAANQQERLAALELSVNNLLRVPE